MQVLTFDFHNTLVHCDPWFELEVRTLPRAVARRLGLAPALTDDTIDAAYRDLRRNVIATGIEINAVDGVSAVFSRLGVATTATAVLDTIDDLMREAQASVAPVDGAVDSVRALRELGIPLGVISSAVHHDTLTWSLEHIGIDDCFDVIVSSASCGHYKSTPAIYAHTLAAMGGTAGRSVHVGDSLKWDVTVSREAGMYPVWLQTTHRETFSQGLPTSEPVLTLQTLAGAGPTLANLLRQILAAGTHV
ncbi:MAG TPA: HAD family hydrolase [Thermomicrobiales bacterium]|nr:HAD family hydrolase [Thermomicrobiales bacterium]